MSNPTPASPPAPPGPAAGPTPPPSKLSALTKVGLLGIPIIAITSIEVGAMIAAGWMSPMVALAILALVGLLASAIAMAVAFNVPLENWKGRAVAIIIWVFIVTQVGVALWIGWTLAKPHLGGVGGVGFNPLDELRTFIEEKIWNLPDAIQCLSDRGGFFRIVFALFSTVVPVYAFFAMFKPLVIVPAMIIFRGVDDKGNKYTPAGRLWAPLAKGGMGAIIFGLFALLYVYILPTKEMCTAPTVATTTAAVVAPAPIPDPPPTPKKRTAGTTKKGGCDPEAVAFLRGLEAGSGSDQYTRAGLKDCLE